jgi:TctA family transporter
MGIAALHGGVSFIAVLIGLFGFAEIARGLLFEAEYTGTRINRVSGGWDQVRSNFSTLFNGSTIGTIVGAIPAAGADVAAFLSYTYPAGSPRRNSGRSTARACIAASLPQNRRTTPASAARCSRCSF